MQILLISVLQILRQRIIQHFSVFVYGPPVVQVMSPGCHDVFLTEKQPDIVWIDSVVEHLRSYSLPDLMMALIIYTGFTAVLLIHLTHRTIPNRPIRTGENETIC